MYLNQPFYAGTAWPIAAWGARIKIAPKKQDFEFWLGVYNGSESDNLDAASEHGVNFKLNLYESTFVQGSFWYKLNQDPEDDGLPGNYKISGFYDSGSFARLDDATQTRRGNPGWYVIADQMLFRERPQATPTDPAKSKRGSKMSSPAPDQGLSAMANFIMHPRTTFNIAPYWVSAGLFYKGAIPHRDADQMSFAFYYAALSPDSQLEFEFQFRFYYSLQITPWFSMSPHVHYFRKPGGGQVANALVFGTFFHITL
jgi:porin